MTVIAFDGKYLVGDRRRTVDGSPMSARKVFKVRANDGRKFLVGCAGCSWDAVAFVRWVSGRGDKPSPTAFCAISIDEKNRIWYVAEKLIYHRITLPYFAIGSGSDYAIGAMACGKTAAEAVRIAIKLDVHCGNGIDSISFERR